MLNGEISHVFTRSMGSPKPKKYMKKTIFLIAAFVLAAVIAHAQTEKGSQTLGLNLGFMYNKNTGINISPYDYTVTDASNKYTTFNLGPVYSYFIANKLELGASFSYAQTSYDYPDLPNNISKTTSHTYDGRIYLRKYFMFTDKIGMRTGPFIEGVSMSNKYTYAGSASIYDYENRVYQYRAGADLGLVFYPAKKLGFAAYLASLSYTHQRVQNGAQGYTNGDAVNFNLVNSGLQLSVFYAFGSK